MVLSQKIEKKIIEKFNSMGIEQLKSCRKAMSKDCPFCVIVDQIIKENKK